MPTGYTAAVEDGTVTDFATFAMQCARGMGALIMMRDEPMDAPIPERFEPSSYHENALDKIRKRIVEVKAMTPEQCDAAAQAEYDEIGRANERENIDAAKRIERYAAMRAKVQAWQPPSSEHAGFKKFMLDQLRIGGEFLRPYTSTRKLQSGTDWRQSQVAKLLKNQQYQANEHAEEVSRTEGRNRWLSQLRESLK
jgi:hypothetical protein